MKHEVNKENVSNYLLSKYPDYPLEYFEGQIDLVIADLQRFGFSKTSEIEDCLKSNRFEILAVERAQYRFFHNMLWEIEHFDDDGYDELSSSFILSIMLCFNDEAYLEIASFKDYEKNNIRLERDLWLNIWQ